MRFSLIVVCSISLALVLLIEEGYAQCSHTTPCPNLSGGAALQQPEQETSVGGSLTITLNIDIADITYDWLTVHRRVYNGKIPGPTWRVKRGDTVTVNLVNDLSLPHKEQAFNEARFPNSTNLHTHGLHISSAVPQDNVFVHVQPETSYTYTYTICPENPAGTYWYHPHLHGSTMLQVHSGLAGMIIVEDPTTGTAAAPAGLAAVSCPGNCNHEVELLFQPTLQYINRAGRGYANIQRDIEDSPAFRHAQYIVTNDANSANLEEWLESIVNGIDYFTVNGQLFPVLTIPAGQTKRFRMVNAGGSSTLELMIVNQGTTTAATGCTFMEIAFDGVYLDAPRSARLGKTLLIPSSKADWLVVCNEPGNYQVRSVVDPADAASMGNFQRHDGVLFSISVSGTTATTTLPTMLPARESFVNDFRSLTQAQVAGRFVIEANPGTQLNRGKFASETDYRFKSELGTVQEWYLTNADPNTGHPIHIHINHFQIISYNAYTGPVASSQMGNLAFYTQDLQLCAHQHANYVAGRAANFQPNFLQYLGHDVRYATGGAGTLGYVEVGEFRDVIIVPPLSNITIRFMNHKFIGEVVMHCHILTHEDQGMMMTTEIVNPGESLVANTLSGTAAPGQCRTCDPFPFNQDTSLCEVPIASATTTRMSPFTLCILALVGIIQLL